MRGLAASNKLRKRVIKNQQSKIELGEATLGVEITTGSIQASCNYYVAIMNAAT